MIRSFFDIFDLLIGILAHNYTLSESSYPIQALLPYFDGWAVEANKLLQKLSKHTGSNFISTKSFLDRGSGKLRANLMRDPIHFNEWGVRILAKEIKKSLYSKANMENLSLSQFVANNQIETRPSANKVDVSDMHGA